MELVKTQTVLLLVAGALMTLVGVFILLSPAGLLLSAGLACLAVLMIGRITARRVT